MHQSSSQDRYWLWLLGGLLVAALLTVPPLTRGLVIRADRQVLDNWHEMAPAAPVMEEIVVLGIDDASLTPADWWPEDIAASPSLQAMQKGLPWPRRVWADLIDKLCQAGAKGVFLDFTFLAPSADPADDAALAAVVAKYPNKVIFGAKYDASATADGGVAVSLGMPHAALGVPEKAIGHLNFIPEKDGIIRRVSPTLDAAEAEAIFSGETPSTKGGVALPAVSHRAAELLGYTPAAGGGILRLGPLNAYIPVPLYEIFVPAMWESNHKNGTDFKDKLVFVGASAQQLQDVQSTAKGDIPGVQLHAHATAAFAQGSFVPEAPEKARWLGYLLGAFAAWLVARSIRNPLANLASIWGITAVAFLVSYQLFAAGKLALSPLHFIAALNGGGVAAMAGRFLHQTKETRQLGRYLARYTSPQLAEELMRDRLSLFHTLSGEEKQVTILFSDVRGFTSFSEGLTPTQVVTQLNEYLSGMVPCVFRRNGMVDKFVGDAVMALWGSLKSEGPKEDALMAVQAALEMRTTLARLNEEWKAAGKPPIAIGIGIHQGPCIVGNMGSAAPYEKMDATVIGDSVNLASRIEGLTKDYACDLIISETVWELVKNDFSCRPLGEVIVKGKSQTVKIFAVN